MIKDYIEKVINKEDLSMDESFDAMVKVMSGSINNSMLSGFLVALKAKGETPAEIAGFARAMRNKSIKIDFEHDKLIDVCGTGGDYSGTFNISTAVAFAAAGAGVKVAKHGNRSISSKCGSADVLSELGININLTKDQSEQALNQIGICFLFAPNYHPAMKYAAPVRKELEIKTVFNLLGPLTNPAGTKKQLIGVFNNKSAKTMSEAAKYLDMHKVCFICTGDKFDEISLTEDCDVHEFCLSKEVSHYKISNESFSYPEIKMEDIMGESPEHNAHIILELFRSKKKTAAFFVVSANTAVALYCAGYSNEIDQCRQAAEDSIMNGSAYDKLVQLKKFGARFS